MTNASAVPTVSDDFLTVCVNTSFSWLNCTLVDLSRGNSTNGTSEELYEPSLGITIVLFLCYGVISAGAILGNLLVIYMVFNSRRMRSITNLFIANLALSDVIIGMFSIPFQFQAALLQRWNLPEVMCNLCPFVTNVSVNTSIFTLIAIALDRYKAIMKPFGKRSTKRDAMILIASIWLLSILLSIPQIIAFKISLVENGIPQCLPTNISYRAFIWYMFCLCFVQYFVPLCLLCYAYARIALNLWGRKAPGEAEERRDANILRNKKKAIKVLMFVVGLFAVCWLPLQTYSVTSVIYEEINNFKYINIVYFVSHWLAMSNSCVNPFVYFFCHDKFKKEFQNKFKWCFKSVAQHERNRRGARRGIRGIQTYHPGRDPYAPNNSSSDENKSNLDVTSSITSTCHNTLRPHNRYPSMSSLGHRERLISNTEPSTTSSRGGCLASRLVTVTTHTMVQTLATPYDLTKQEGCNNLKVGVELAIVDHHTPLTSSNSFQTEPSDFCPLSHFSGAWPPLPRPRSKRTAATAATASGRRLKRTNSCIV